MAASDEQAILDIVARFAWHIDRQEWAAIGELFADLTYTSPGIDDTAVSGAAALAAFYERVTTEMDARWAGDPEDAKTVGHKHVFTNHLIEIAEDRATATCQYYGTVMSFSAAKPLQPRWSGRYEDRFVRRDGVWRIVARRQETDYPIGYRPS
ncbi:MAG TPA: nuclear transport factor 2 family protein [Acidimicrobiales bacterium]|jgi:hypothetical protein|nr:nuclear transport factor 2 family protein [Acidimicrobiales bacterium]